MSLIEKSVNNIGDYYIKALVDNFKEECNKLLDSKTIAFEDKVDMLSDFKKEANKILDELDDNINYSNKIQKIIGHTIRNTKEVINYTVVSYYKKLFNYGGFSKL